ncbi:MAG: maleylpyruvate isomerase family mycothiol-dependent enzyme [Chloroflexi bacterium]|nr:maleylpyruvate isomerase family mycothiol-dependent enzyme [Chloroflexota bacterium]
MMTQTLTGSQPDTITNAAQIAPIARDEVDALALEAWKRLLNTLEGLNADDWNKPTPCTAWTVRDMVAHQAGAYATFSSFAELRRQYFAPVPKGRLAEDSINEIQIADRKHKTNAELVAEIREKGPRTIKNRRRIPFFLRAYAPPRADGYKLTLGHLLDVIFTRDSWMHRLDLARATNREMKLTRDHDGRIVELVMRDVNILLAPKLGGDALDIELTGIAGGVWRVGNAPTARANLRMDALDFNIYASGRYTYAQARGKAILTGDTAFAENLLRQISILY